MSNINYEVVLTKPHILMAVDQLARKIITDYDADEGVTFIIVANGALHFASDLVASIVSINENFRHTYDVIKVSSYSRESNTRGAIKFLSYPTTSLITDKHVVIIDDIFDTGLTIAAITDSLNELSPKSVNACALVSKKSREDSPKYTGLLLKDTKKWYYGYGMDLSGECRSIQELRAVVI